MLFNEKCGICREKIPGRESFYKLVFSEYCSVDSYDDRAILFICYGCFARTILGTGLMLAQQKAREPEDET